MIPVQPPFPLVQDLDSQVWAFPKVVHYLKVLALHHLRGKVRHTIQRRTIQILILMPHLHLDLQLLAWQL